MGLSRYRSSIALPKITSPEQAFIQAVIDGKVIGDDKSKHQNLLSDPMWASFSEAGESLTIQVPCNHNVIPETSELWLTLTVDFKCGHISGAEFFSRPIF